VNQTRQRLRGTRSDENEKRALALAKDSSK